MKKRMLAVCLAGLLSCSCLAGCGGSTDTSPEGGSQSQEGTNGQAQTGQESQEIQNTPVETVDGLSTIFPLEEPVTMDMFIYQTTGRDITTNLAWTTMEDLTNMHWDLTIVTGSDIEEKRQLDFSGGQYKSVYFKSNMSESDAIKYAEEGIVIPLNDLIDQYMPNLKAWLDENDQWAYVTSSDGNIYSLPQANQDGAGMMLFINEQWLKNLNLEAPTTFEEYVDVLRAFKTGDPNQNGEADEIPFYTCNGVIDMLLPYYGISYDGNTWCTYENGVINYVPTSDGYKEFLRTMKTLWDEGLMNNYILGDWNELSALGTTEDVIGSLLQWGAYLAVGAEKDEDWPAVVMDDNTMVLSSGIQFGGLVITDKCERPDLVCQWADYFYSDQGANLVWMGLEGESYQMNDDGTYEWLTGKWGEDMSDIRYNAGLFGDYAVPAAYSKLFNEGQTNPEEKYLYTQRQKIIAHGCEKFPKLSYTSEELERKATLQADINSYIYQYEAQVITGEVDLDSSWDGYVQMLKQMNVEELNSIDQAAVTRFYENH